MDLTVVYSSEEVEGKFQEKCYSSFERTILFDHVSGRNNTGNEDTQ